MKFLKYLSIAALSLLNLVIFAQDYDFYKKQAYTCFDNGEYEKAQKALNVYNEMTENEVTGLSEKVALCLNYQASAKEAEQSGDYASAKSYYESILKCNPKDPNAGIAAARLNALINTSFSAESRLQIGDQYDRYTICYLDGTGKHGWLMKVNTYYPSYCNRMDASDINQGWRRPSVEEIKLIYPNRYKLGLNKRYWTCTISKRIINLHFYYTMDFGTGKVKSASATKEDTWSIYIKNF